MPSSAVLGSAPAPYASSEPIQGGKLPQTHPLVNYRYARDPAQSCATCSHFEAPGGCELVTGMIRPVDVCDLWEGELGQRTATQATLAGDMDEGEADAEAGTSQGAKKGWASRKGGEPARAVFAKDQPESDEERQVARFARSEQPAVRAQRVARTPVEPVRAQAIKRAFGWQAEQERGAPVRAELIPTSSFERFKAVLAECRAAWQGILDTVRYGKQD